MADTGILAQKPRSATGLALVIALHAAALTALALSKMEVPIVERLGPLVTYRVDPPKPPPEPTPKPEPRPRSKSVIDHVPAKVPTPPVSDPVLVDLTDLPTLPTHTIVGIDPPKPPARPAPQPEPVRVEARMSPKSELQPPYPASEQRMGREGSVAIRLLIGADGRVKGAEKLRATSDAFYRATERHALNHWRFSPATVDGRPVEAWKTLTVYFRLDG